MIRRMDFFGDKEQGHCRDLLWKWWVFSGLGSEIKYKLRSIQFLAIDLNFKFKKSENKLLQNAFDQSAIESGQPLEKW